jgi:ubiquinone/menaquinone biosynthesis C-methylase UbiE
MGGKRRKTNRKPVTTRKNTSQSEEGFRRAYHRYEEGAKKLIEVSRRRSGGFRKGWERRRVGRLNGRFNRFFRVTEKEIKRNETMYDLHRHSIYTNQTTRLQSMYAPYLADCSSLLDIGCGSGKLMRRIVRTKTRMKALEEGRIKMSMLGIDFNEAALTIAALKRRILFDHHPMLKQNFAMEFVLMDLIDLPQLDLRETAIGESRVDVILATDIFRWILRNERQNLLEAMRVKIKETGFLISMEFAYPHLPPGEYLPAEFAIRMSEFTTREHMKMAEFFEMVEKAGFSISNKTIDATNVPIYDPFPPLVSVIFRPRMSASELSILGIGSQNKGDLSAGIMTAAMLHESNYDVNFREEHIEKVDKGYLLIIGAADIERGYILTDKRDSVKFHESNFEESLDKKIADLEKKGIKVLFAGIKPENTQEQRDMTDVVRERCNKLVREIIERWKF